MRLQIDSKMVRVLEQCLLLAGLALLVVYGIARIDASIASRSALRRFEAAKKAAEDVGPGRSVERHDGVDVDFALWSPQRIRAYHESLESKLRAPMAVLSIPKLRLRVPVFEGTDDLTLNRGAGWIIGTAKPGEAGNIGIAGHRDGFFRGLKDVSVGDEIDLETTQGSDSYFVGQEQMVGPDDVSVLKPRSAPALTLVTCYPFYYVGHAPQRYIIMASRSRKGERK